MAIDFPSSPTLNQQYTFSNRTWQWNGEGWQVVSNPASFAQSVQTVQADTTVPTIAGYNQAAFIEMAIASGVTLTITSGEVLTIYP